MTEVSLAPRLEVIDKMLLASTPQNPLKVVNAVYSSGHISLGDLRELGYARYHRAPVGRNGSESWWSYTGPTPIQVGKEIWYPGYVEEPIEKDYS